MQKLISELTRLYLLKGQQYREQSKDGDAGIPAGDLSSAILEQHLRGEKTLSLDLVSEAGLTRALLIDFHGAAAGKGEEHWSKLCEVANALQDPLGLPAPAVSISGGKGYGLWLSLATPIPVAQAQQFLRLLRKTYFQDLRNEGADEAPDAGGAAEAANTVAELPPCLHSATGMWAAFINPGMGASFAEEPGLEMAPPHSAQAAFLADLKSVTDKQFTQAFNMLEQMHGTVPEAVSPPLMPVHVSSGLLLKDASLEDIVRHLHGKNIEPTFRHLIVK